MLNTFSQSLAIWEPAILKRKPRKWTGSQKANWGRAEQFTHVENYTLTPAYVNWIIRPQVTLLITDK